MTFKSALWTSTSPIRIDDKEIVDIITHSAIMITLLEEIDMENVVLGIVFVALAYTVLLLGLSFYVPISDAYKEYKEGFCALRFVIEEVVGGILCMACIGYIAIVLLGVL